MSSDSIILIIILVSVGYLFTGIFSSYIHWEPCFSKTGGWRSFFLYMIHVFFWPLLFKKDKIYKCFFYRFVLTKKKEG